MRRTVGLLFALFFLGGAAHTASAVEYGWRVSKSSVDPFVQTGSPNGGTDNLYLWLTCTLNEGMSAAEMTLESIPPGQVLAFNPINGFLNAGNATNLLLAVGGCPEQSIVAGSILILHFAPLALCLGGANVTVDCSPNPQAWPHFCNGYADLGLPLCLNDSEVICDPFSIEAQSWGTIKSLYR